MQSDKVHINTQISIAEERLAALKREREKIMSLKHGDIFWDEGPHVAVAKDPFSPLTYLGKCGLGGQIPGGVFNPCGNIIDMMNYAGRTGVLAAFNKPEVERIQQSSFTTKLAEIFVAKFGPGR